MSQGNSTWFSTVVNNFVFNRRIPTMVLKLANHRWLWARPTLRNHALNSISNETE